MCTPVCGPLPVRKRVIVASLSPAGWTIRKETVTGFPAATGALGWKSTVCVVSAFWIVGAARLARRSAAGQRDGAREERQGEGEGAASGHWASLGNRYEVCGTT